MMRKNSLLTLLLFTAACGEPVPEPAPNSQGTTNTKPGNGPAKQDPNVDLAFQTPYLDVEQNDELCSNSLNDFQTVDKNGNISTWVDCANYGCAASPLVQVCESLENNDARCSDGVDNANATSNMPSGFGGYSNGLIDCADPSCFKNPRVTVCPEEAPKYELGDGCSDGIDNDGDGLADCQDLDCLHAGASNCDLGNYKRILFDNGHHQIAGQADWIIDVTGRHPFPTRPAKEDDWHGSLSSFGKDLIDSGHYVLETLIQNRKFIYGTNENPQDLKNYHLVVSVEPSAKFTKEEAVALGQFVKNGGSLLLFADHKGADRDGNNVDSVDAINDLIGNIASAAGENNPFGFTVLGDSKMANEVATPSLGAAEHPIINGSFGVITKTGSYAGTGFELVGDNAEPLLETPSGKTFAVAATYGRGKIVAVGDSSIVGDGTNYLAIVSSKKAYHDQTLDNRSFLLNAVEWLLAE